MAERPSVQEILEIVRRTGPPQPSDESEAVAPEPPAEPAPPPVEAESMEAAAEAPPPASAPPPPPPDPGRPLTLQEKLAAARNRPVSAAPTPPPASAPPPAPPESTEPAEAAPPAPAAPPPPPDPGRPLTLQEKLAAARAGSAGAAPAAKAPTAKAAPASKPAAAASRELPPLDKITDPRDLAEALRRAGAAQEKKAAPAPAKAPAKKPAAAPRAVPPRPTRGGVAPPPPGGPEVQAERRGFLIGMSITAVLIAGWAAFAAGMGLMLSMFGRFFFPNVLAEPPSSLKVGLPDTFEPEVVDERFLAEWGFWVIRSTEYDGIDKVYALQSVCTHLGCPPNWLASELKFKCPCHGSGFYISGVNFEGPAPRPLERFRVALADDGQILVDKSQLFQEELGQWTDPDSFIPV